MTKAADSIRLIETVSVGLSGVPDIHLSAPFTVFLHVQEKRCQSQLDVVNIRQHVDAKSS